VLWDGQLPVDAFDAEGRAVCKKLPFSRLKVDFAVRVPNAGLVPSCRHVHDTAPVLPAASRRSAALGRARARAQQEAELPTPLGGEGTNTRNENQNHCPSCHFVML
jgi:hypothetical protein